MNRRHLPVVAIACMLVLTHMLALWVVNLYPQEYRAFGEDVDDPTNPLIYIGAIILFTAVLLLIMKYSKGNFLPYLILGVVALTLFYVFYPVYFYFIPYRVWAFVFWVDIPLTLTLITTGTLTALLYFRPEWYVIDSLGLIMGAGIAAIFGLSMGILPVLILLIVLAVYDAISVYKTKHMISLASGVMKMKMPVMLVVPDNLKYTFTKEKGIIQDVDKRKKRDAMFIGLGDLIIPGILPVSASLYLEPVSVMGTSGPLLVALGSTIGAVIGLLILMRYVLKGNPQAGLPLLNSGAILGFVITYVAIYRDFGLGIFSLLL